MGGCWTAASTDGIKLRNLILDWGGGAEFWSLVKKIVQRRGDGKKKDLHTWFCQQNHEQTARVLNGGIYWHVWSTYGGLLRLWIDGSIS